MQLPQPAAYAVRLAAAIVTLSTVTLPLCAQDKAYSPAELMQLNKISGVQVSPDGKRVVYAVRQAVMEPGKSEYRAHIYMVNADGSGTVHLTMGDNPQWSPNGRWIAYTSARSGKKNIWVTPPEPGDGVRLTSVESSVTSFKWLPSSDRISYTALPATSADDLKAKKDKNDARVVDEHPKRSRVYVVSLDDRGGPKGGSLAEIEQWTALLPGGVTGATTHGGYDWSPDGKKLTVAYLASDRPDDWPTARLVTLGPPGPDLLGLGNYKPGPAEFSPLWSPDGQWIAFVKSDDPPGWGGAGHVHIMPAKGGKAIALAGTADYWGRYSELIGWSADSKSLYYTEMIGTTTGVARMNIDRSAQSLHPHVIQNRGVATGIHLNATRTHFGFTWETLDQPPEACISPVDRFEPVRVSKVNADRPKRALGHTEVTKWPSKGGKFLIEGLLTYPANYEQGKRFPLLVYVHGGPMGVFTQTYVASPGLYPVASFSGKDYVVLRPNPRGSSGYGKEFRYANYGDWGGGDFQDIMAGVDHVIKMGLADPDRLGIMGWSYGGYMTSWTITQTKRFKAASVGAGVTNLMSFTGTADIPGFLPDYFRGEFWNDLEPYRKHSPVLHIKGVTTPTLIQHGERDERVPLSQGQELYNALKRQGCITKMVIYPRTPHSIEEPRLLVDCMERNLEWFDRYVMKAK